MKRELQNGKGGTWGRPMGSGWAAVIQTCLFLASVSISGQQCQEEQKQGWSSIQQLIAEARQHIDMIQRNVHVGNEKVKTLSTGAPADPYWEGFVSCWALGDWGRREQGSALPVLRV